MVIHSILIRGVKQNANGKEKSTNKCNAGSEKQHRGKHAFMHLISDKITELGLREVVASKKKALTLSIELKDITKRLAQQPFPIRSVS